MLAWNILIALFLLISIAISVIAIIKAYEDDDNCQITTTQTVNNKYNRIYSVDLAITSKVDFSQIPSATDGENIKIGMQILLTDASQYGIWEVQSSTIWVFAQEQMAIGDLALIEKGEAHGGEFFISKDVLSPLVPKFNNMKVGSINNITWSSEQSIIMSSSSSSSGTLLTLDSQGSKHGSLIVKGGGGSTNPSALFVGEKSQTNDIVSIDGEDHKGACLKIVGSQVSGYTGNCLDITSLSTAISVTGVPSTVAMRIKGCDNKSGGAPPGTVSRYVAVTFNDGNSDIKYYLPLYTVP